MPDFDLLIRDARLATGDGTATDIGISEGAFAAVGPDLAGSARDVLDARGLLALPGGVDPHVHFNEPGRTDWEGWASGSAAAAAGGLTTVIEMPLNAHPPTVDGSSFDAKRACAEASSYVDFALWGGVIPGNRAELPVLAARGVIGFKAFMSATGTSDFPASDDLTLYEAMGTIAELGLPLALHAESERITADLAARARAAGRMRTADYLASRPPVAESEAIARAIELASVTGCQVHIVHVSTARAVDLITVAYEEGVGVTCEVAAHHLVLTDEDAIALGAVAKCAPPLRQQAETEALWERLADGRIGCVVSDHSPAPPEMKSGDDAFATWGGISGVQSTLELLLTDGRMPLPRLAEITATAAAARFALPGGKGTIAPGADADLVLVRSGEPRELTAGELRYRHPISPYVGRTLSARVARTLLRGHTIYADGAIAGEAGGRLLTPV